MIIRIDDKHMIGDDGLMLQTLEEVPPYASAVRVTQDDTSALDDLRDRDGKISPNTGMRHSILYVGYLPDDWRQCEQGGTIYYYDILTSPDELEPVMTSIRLHQDGKHIRTFTAEHYPKRRFRDNYDSTPVEFVKALMEGKPLRLYYPSLGCYSYYL